LCFACSTTEASKKRVSDEPARTKCSQRKVKAARGERNATSCFQIRRDFLLSPDSIGIECGLCRLNVTEHHERKKKDENLTKTKASTRSRYTQFKIAASTQQQRILYSTRKKNCFSLLDKLGGCTELSNSDKYLDIWYTFSKPTCEVENAACRSKNRQKNVLPSISVSCIIPFFGIPFLTVAVTGTLLYI
jgi:hypothetical protein